MPASSYSTKTKIANKKIIVLFQFFFYSYFVGKFCISCSVVATNEQIKLLKVTWKYYNGKLFQERKKYNRASDCETHQNYSQKCGTNKMLKTIQRTTNTKELKISPNDGYILRLMIDETIFIVCIFVFHCRHYVCCALYVVQVNIVDHNFHCHPKILNQQKKKKLFTTFSTTTTTMTMLYTMCIKHATFSYIIFEIRMITSLSESSAPLM